MVYRAFSLSEAIAILPDIARLTRRYREEMEHVWSTLDDDSTQTDLRECDRRLHTLKCEWAARIKELGAIPIRLWEVSFDSGDGYFFSWRIGESTIEYVHRPTRYAFAIRRKIPKAA